jgi:glutamyl-tRNA reductase
MIKVSSHNHPLLFSIGINHRTAPLEAREKMSISEDRLPEILNRFKDDLAECMIISTCNRTELYGVTNGSGLDSEYIKQMMIDVNGAFDIVKKEHFYEFILGSAADQMFKVATSIDSMVVGDSQVMHQIKKSYQIACDNGSTGKVLNQMVQKAFHTAKRVKSETALFEGAFSISYAAVELATKIFGELKDMTALVIGAGETAELTIENLLKKNIKKVYITNRTKSHADSLLSMLKKHGSFEGEVLEYNEYKQKLSAIDMIISSTGANNYILKYDEFKDIAKKKRGAPILIVDIAVPRDIDPKIDTIGNVFLKNIDDLTAIVDTNYGKRTSVIPEIKKIISHEVLEFLIWYYTIPVLPAIQFIQANFNGQRGAKIKEIRNYLVENVTNIHGKVNFGTSTHHDELRYHSELVRNLEKINQTNLQKNQDQM